MASLVLRIPAGVVMSNHSIYAQSSHPLRPSFDFKVECNALVSRERSFLLNTDASRHSNSRPLVATRVSEEASTETAGGVTEVEDEATLEQYFKEAGDKLVVLDVSTKTCGPCKMIYPKVVKMSREYPDAVFLKINGDQNKDTRALMRKWGVRAVPNFRFFRNGQLVHSHTGANEDELRAKFLAHYMERVQV